jgi:hypothetical protein
MKLVPLKRLDATQQQAILDKHGAYYQTAKGSPVTLAETVLDAMEPLATPATFTSNIRL